AGMFGISTFTVKVQDNGGTSNGGVNLSAAQTFTITVNRVNRPPVAVADSYTVAEGSTLTTTPLTGVLANDTDADEDLLTASLVSGPAHGTLTFTSLGTFSYMPEPYFNGKDGFSYKVSDGQ